MTSENPIIGHIYYATVSLQKEADVLIKFLRDENGMYKFDLLASSDRERHGLLKNPCRGLSALFMNDNLKEISREDLPLYISMPFTTPEFREALCSLKQVKSTTLPF